MTSRLLRNVAMKTVLALLLGSFVGSAAAVPSRGEAPADRLTSREVVRLELELFRLRAAGSPEAKPIEARLLAGGSSPSDLTPDALRARVVSRLRGDLANVSGDEHRGRVERALALGITAAELGVDDGPLAEADVGALVGTVLIGPIDEALEASARLGRVTLAPGAASPLLAGVRTTSDDRAGHVAWSLAGTPTPEVLEGLVMLVSDASLPATRRDIALAVLVHADRHGVHASSALKLIESDPALQAARGLARFVAKMPRTALAGPAGTRIAELAASRETSPEVRLAAIRRLGASSVTGHGDILLRVLHDGSEEIPLRLAALNSLRRDRLKFDDPVIIALLRDDPSLEFRRAVADTYTHVGPFPGDADLRAALATVERDPSARNP